MSPKEYAIPAPLVQGIVNVLGALPWNQVSNLMSDLVAVVTAQENAQPAPEAKAKRGRKPATEQSPQA